MQSPKNLKSYFIYTLGKNLYIRIQFKLSTKNWKFTWILRKAKSSKWQSSKNPEWENSILSISLSLTNKRKYRLRRAARQDNRDCSSTRRRSKARAEQFESETNRWSSRSTAHTFRVHGMQLCKGNDRFSFLRWYAAEKAHSERTHRSIIDSRRPARMGTKTWPIQGVSPLCMQMYAFNCK